MDRNNPCRYCNNRSSYTITHNTLYRQTAMFLRVFGKRITIFVEKPKCPNWIIYVSGRKEPCEKVKDCFFAYVPRKQICRIALVSFNQPSKEDIQTEQRSDESVRTDQQEKTEVKSIRDVEFDSEYTSMIIFKNNR